MLSRLVTLGVSISLLAAASASSQSVTFTPTAYPANNLTSANGGINGHIHADLNGDGIEDFISENDASFASGCTGSFAVTLSKSDGTYAAPVCYTLPSGNARLFAAADFYDDGILSLVVSNDDDTIFLYENDGTGNLTQRSSVQIGGMASGLVAADVNHDGVADVVYDIPDTNGVDILGVLWGRGGSFTPGPASSFNMNLEPTAGLAIGDFDNDSKVDIVAVGVSQVENEILYGNDEGNFTPGPIVGGSTTQYVPFDFGSNGTMDLIGAPFTSDPGGTPTYYNYLDLEIGHSNRTLTSQHIALKSCTASGTPPAMADFNGDGINDVAVIEAADCKGDGPYTLNVLLGNANGTFQPEQVVYTSDDWMYETHVIRASQNSKPDLEVFAGSLQDNQLLNPEELVMVNTSTGGFPACAAPVHYAPGVNVCSPTSTTGATSPVNFSFGSANDVPGRDMELWVDGTKVDENLKNTYSYYSFLNATVPLSNGQHTVTAYSVGWDYSLKNSTFVLTVGNNTCPAPTSAGLNVCSPITDSTVTSPMLALASGTVTGYGNLVRMEVWVDGVKQYTTFGSNTLQTQLRIGPGWHKIDYYLVSSETQWEYTVYATAH